MRNTLTAIAVLAASSSAPAADREYDVVVYGGTSGGVAAAVQAARLGKSVILIEPGKHLGGLTSGGLGATDIGNKKAIGGLSREFYQRIKAHYTADAAWTREKRADFKGRGHDAGEDAAWTFEPHVAGKVFNDLVKEHKVAVVFGQRLDLKAGVRKDGTRIVSVTMETGEAYRGKVFIDATYEGDLMAKAGVGYHVGREARRMIGAYVMAEQNCRGTRTVDDPVGLAADTMDSHHVRRYVTKDGFARNEGDAQVGGFPPYPVAYHSLTPKAAESTNLLVPVCLSASHIAYGAIRMEPVFMVLGQSAATAAALAIDDKADVQKVDYAKLRKRLLDDKQVLEWTGAKAAGAIDPKTLPGVVVDDAAAERKGFDGTSSLIGPFVGDGYRHDGGTDRGKQTARFRPDLPKAGKYEVRLSYTANGNRATKVPVTVAHANGRRRWP